VKRIIENPQIDEEYAVRLLSTNTLNFYGERLKRRIEPLLCSQRPQLEGPGKSFEIRNSKFEN
jgi:hypothetical protein